MRPVSLLLRLRGPNVETHRVGATRFKRNNVVRWGVLDDQRVWLEAVSRMTLRLVWRRGAWKKHSYGSGEHRRSTGPTEQLLAPCYQLS
jgi:hypothetical protein